MRKVGSVIIAALVVVAIGLAGTAGAAQGGPLSKPDYIAAADNICRQANQLREEAASTAFADVAAGGQPTDDQTTNYVANIEPINSQQLDSLRALPAPKSDKKLLKKIYKLVEKAFDAISADPTVLSSGSNVFAKADKAAQKYGFKVCGSSG